MFRVRKTILYLFVLTFILNASLSGVELQAQNMGPASLPAINIKVEAGRFERKNTPVSAYLNELDLRLAEYDLQLVELTRDGEKKVASQLETGYQPLLHWTLEGTSAPGSVRYYQLKSVPKKEASASKTVAATDNGEAVQFKVQGKEVLAYHYGLTDVPAEVSDRYKRGGYIHPLKSPKGGVLTRIQPSDHYHHYGIWNPWTHTEFEGKELDFWNLYKGQGTVQVKDIPRISEGEVYGQLQAVHEHVVLDTLDAQKNKVALNEVWDIRVWNADPEAEVFLVDFTSTMSCATSSPFTIKEYRYQGFGFRANEKWDDQSASLLTSEGYNKENGNATRARWCQIDGPTQAGQSGVVFMTSPFNYNYPEQLRIWPTGANNGKENVFFNFNPTQDRDWVLEPGNTYSLKYRMLVYDGELDKSQAERYWNDFANPPKVELSISPSLQGKKVMVYTKNGEGFVHDNIPASIEAIQKLGKENGFDVVASENPADFTEENLQQFDVLIFSNTNNEIFDIEAQKQAFQKYIRSGGGFVAIHSASGSMRKWDWFAQMLGARFFRHPPRQNFDVEVVDHHHPSTAFLPDIWKVVDDECYYLKNLNPSNHVLLAADMSTVEDDKKGEYPANFFGERFPLAWYHKFDGGRQWYTALGHRIEHYSDPVFMRHILGGIQWAAGND
ncbi:ThuA domain-containing protein [Porifericola rhodea]|uniref:ThuA domain-containing protein n=1 Tax=Porifericola rhodea TaxID=930972 RepID=UPI002666606B|nr:ThuA domain-containing protein [Porifericola rhodea]WKN32339.1 ThuA domain-containing protein [Porifericola rhodea]